MPLLSRLAVQAARAYGMLVGSSANNVTTNFLVVAGGGSGGSQDNEGGGGGGGAGGFRTSAGTSGGGAAAESAITLSALNTYTIIVGAGGAQVGGGVAAVGNDGSNSSISGTGLTTITSIGGGGGTFNTTGRSGGSGGGIETATNATNTGTGTAGQGFAGGNIVNNTGYQVGSGGGGAGAVGANGTGSGSSVAGGNGGAGVASSISGSSVTYAGGGGGSADNRISNTLGSGGAGGGGAATNGNGTRATAGTANRGGGGGGSGGAGSGSGGSGIVIISYTSATPKFVGGTITTSGGNQIHTFTSSGTLSPITPITASYLVVAGGGGGGSRSAGGGGAGGLLTSSTTLYSGATYVVTVGAGGAGAASASEAQGTSGSNSIVSGTGLTTLTSTGGGGGGGNTTRNGLSGGSGGGASRNGTVGSGTSGQGNNGGSGNDTPNFNGGGGGGSSAVGGNAVTSTAGSGGAGTSSSISGSAITYAGGGGGGAYTGSTAGTGGSGGGGNGGSSSAIAGSGTANLGGGGGGGGENASNNGGSGGSGIVIISYAGSQAFNGGLVTTSGGNTIHTFTSTGALTPLTNNLTNSLRFRSSASAYLNRTPTVAGNRKTFTWSAWVKRGALGSDYGIFSAGTNSSNAIDAFEFNSSNQIRLYSYNSAYLFQYVTTAVYRDPSAWYHIVVAVDTTQATAGNRVKLYVNGQQVTAFSTQTDPTQNSDCYFFNSASLHAIGATYNNSRFLDGYQTDINFIDGQALEPYYFGNNDANGVWKPIQYKGTYGTNGFYLTFGNTTSTTTLGYDSSPNGNNWTCNNISLTAGVTYDAMTDVPTNTSATVANYATWNPLQKYSGLSAPTNSNLTIAGNSANWRSILSTFAVSSGKWYCEIVMTSVSADAITGIFNINSASDLYDLTTVDNRQLGRYAGGYGYQNNGNKINNNTGTSYGSTYTTGDIVGIAFDLDNGKIWFSKNGTWQASGDPAAGTNAAYTGLSGLFAVGMSTANGTFDANFGQRAFSYTPPTGFVRLNTFNLPTPTILQGNKYMDATLWTGNGSAQTIVNQAQFKPDFVWAKQRNSTAWHSLVDAVRGVTKYLYSNTTDAEGTQTTLLTSFNSNGFSLSSDSNVNGSGSTYVAWQWQAGQGSTSSNTSGSITSTVSVNTTAGFSIVTYTGTGANATVGHGLGVAPAMVIVKRRSSTGNWNVRHVSIIAANSLYLNLTNASQSDPTVWNSTVPTSTVFSIGTDTGVNASGATYVAYCWAEIAGFSKFGSYTGNGSADGPFVFTGFRPKFVMTKRTDSSTNGFWNVYDSSRNGYNDDNDVLYPNSSSAEDNVQQIDLLSNGFKLRNATYPNTSGGTYIYAAFAEHPFKNSNAR